MPRITIYLPEHIYSQLELLSAIWKRSINSIIREAIENYLANLKQKSY